jgi:sugar/nucleoside kinase (ribokinase family)
MAHRFASQTTPVSRGAPASASSGAAGAPAPDARRDRSPGLVVGLGDPVSDILVRLEDADLARRVFAKCGIDEPGGCLPVDSDADIQRLLTACGDEWVDGAGVPTATADEEEDSCEPSFCPGGSAANVCKGIANLSLGCDAAFVGMVGRDDVGRRYQSLLAAQNVRPVLLTTAPGDDVSSAQCLSLVERGGQRTMRTFLGASLRMRAGDFPADEAFGEAPRLLHVEGYTLYRPALAKQAMREAKKRGALVSLDLASFEVVRNCRAALIEILSEGHVDLLFANEDEAAELLRGDETSEEGRAFEERRGEESKMSSNVDERSERRRERRKKRRVVVFAPRRRRRHALDASALLVRDRLAGRARVRLDGSHGVTGCRARRSSAGGGHHGRRRRVHRGVPRRVPQRRRPAGVRLRRVRRRDRRRARARRGALARDVGGAASHGSGASSLTTRGDERRRRRAETAKTRALVFPRATRTGARAPRRSPRRRDDESALLRYVVLLICSYVGAVRMYHGNE